MSKALAVFLALTVTSPAGYAVGALARNPNNNDSAVVVNRADGSTAQHDALLACGDDCVIVQVFQNSCVAYAADHREGSTIYGFGRASNEYRAGETALDNCQSSGGSCTVMSSGCDGH